MIVKAVFLDRDGVINDNRIKVNRPKDLILYPWTAPAIQRLNKAGYLTFIVTNQGGIELGYFTEKDLAEIHGHLQDLLRAAGAYIDEIVYCPHFNRNCDCRKPKPGMILQLGEKYKINLSSAWMIGDRDVDILAGKAAGCRTIKLGKQDVKADYYCENLAEAVEILVKEKIVIPE